MLFSTTTFIFIFLPIVIAVYYVFLSKTKNIKNIFLLIASIIFYAWGEPYFVLIMILSIMMNWIFGLLIHKFSSNKAKSKLILIIMLVFNLGILRYI